MSLSKRVAYLKGLAEGLNLGQGSKEEKILSVIIDILEEISGEIEDLQDDVLSLDGDIDQLCEDLHDLEDAIMEEDGGPAERDAQFFEVRCPRCKHQITIDEDVLDLGSISCPNCNEELEFDLDGQDCNHCDE